MTDARAELQTLQVGRGLAALAVLMFHANIVISLPKYFGEEVAPWVQAGDSGVDYFFVLSGFVMVIAHWGQIGDGQPVTFWWRRFRRLYPALWVVLTLSFGAQQVMGPTDLNLWDVVNGYLVLPSETERLLAVEWTLRHEVIFYAFFGVLIWRRALGCGLLALWFLSGLVGLTGDFDYPAAFWFNPVHLHFGLGCLVGVLFRRNVLARAPTWAIHLLWLAGTALFLGAWTVSCLVEPTPPILRPAGFGVAAAMMIWGLATLEGRVALKIWKPLRLLGDASYSVYLTHFLLLSALAKITLVIDRTVSLPPAAWWLIIVGGALVGGVVFYVLVERPLLHLIPNRPGERSPTSRLRTGHP